MCTWIFLARLECHTVPHTTFLEFWLSCNVTKMYMWLWLNRFIRIVLKYIKKISWFLIQKVIDLLCTFQGHLPSFSTLDETAATNNGWTFACGKSGVASWFFPFGGFFKKQFIKNVWKRYKIWVKEAIEIKKRREATMNRDEGQYFLSHVFDELLLEKSPKRRKPTGNTRFPVSGS